MATRSPRKPFWRAQAESQFGGQTRVLVVTLVLIAGLAIFGVGSRLASAQSDSATATAGACPAGTSAKLCVTINEEDIYFQPNLITIPADTPVEFIITNGGAVAHNFAITDHDNSGLKNLNVSIDTDPGKTSQTTINAPEGDYYFYCNVPGHEAAGMRGYITVKKDAKITTSEATVTPRAG